MLGTLVGGRICVPKAILSASKVAISIAIRYALKRRQFKDDQDVEVCILNYPSHQQRLVPTRKSVWLSYRSRSIGECLC